MRFSERLPRTEAHTLTVKPESLDGSGLSGNSRVLKLNLSSRPGSMFILGLLSLSSASSGELAITRLGRSGWYLSQKEHPAVSSQHFHLIRRLINPSCLLT